MHTTQQHTAPQSQAIAEQANRQQSLPINFITGLFSILPDTPWLAEAVANNGCDELRAVGGVQLPAASDQFAGKVSDNSTITLTADEPCTLEVYRSLREVDFAASQPTWHGSGRAKWQVSGATGPADATLLGTLRLQANQPQRLAGPEVAEAFREAADGVLTIIVRRADHGPETIQISGLAEIENAQPKFNGARP